VRDWDDLEGWIVARAVDTEAVFRVNLDADGPGHWRPAIRQRFGFQSGGQQIS
jgi:hypothetical protein